MGRSLWETNMPSSPKTGVEMCRWVKSMEIAFRDASVQRGIIRSDAADLLPVYDEARY